MRTHAESASAGYPSTPATNSNRTGGTWLGARNRARRTKVGMTIPGPQPGPSGRTSPRGQQGHRSDTPRLPAHPSIVRTSVSFLHLFSAPRSAPSAAPLAAPGVHAIQATQPWRGLHGTPLQIESPGDAGVRVWFWKDVRRRSRRSAFHEIRAWSGWPDSNRRPRRPKRRALTKLRYIPLR